MSDQENSGTEMVLSEDLDKAVEMAVSREGVLDVCGLPEKALKQAARSGKLTVVTVRAPAEKIGGIVMSEPHDWTPEERKAIAARAGVKVAQKIAQQYAEDNGFLRVPPSRSK